MFHIGFVFKEGREHCLFGHRLLPGHSFHYFLHDPYFTPARDRPEAK
jgi:hypothetical protein